MQAMTNENDLLRFFLNHKENKILKWRHYFDVYDRYFSKYRGLPVRILEIGVFDGGSLHMWRDYFGTDAQIFGIDILPECKKLEDDGFHISIGSQTDRSFLRAFLASTEPFDIILDDGGHTMRQQITTFQELYKHVKPDGLYLCEDMHTSYWSKYGGGIRRPGTFMEYSKKMVDQLNAWHSEQSRFHVDQITKTTYSVHYYDSIVVFEKRLMNPPEKMETGEYSIVDYDRMTNRSLGQRIQGRLYMMASQVLRLLHLPG